MRQGSRKEEKKKEKKVFSHGFKLLKKKTFYVVCDFSRVEFFLGVAKHDLPARAYQVNRGRVNNQVVVLRGLLLL